MTQGGATASPSSDNGIPMPPEDVMLAPEVDGDGNYLNVPPALQEDNYASFIPQEGKRGTGVL